MRQVLLVSGEPQTLIAIHQLLPSAQAHSFWARDAARHVAERRAKWAANAPALIQLFSAMGVLTEVCEGAPSTTTTTTTLSHGAVRTRFRSLRGLQSSTLAGGARGQAATSVASTASSWRINSSAAGAASTAGGRATCRCPGTLASHGYAQHISQIPRTAAGAPAGPSRWLLDAGWCSSLGELVRLPGLAAWPIEPVVSARQEADSSVISAVLSAASAATGLDLSSPGSSIPIPSRSVASMEDAAWLAFPGRYCWGKQRLHWREIH